MGLTLDEIRLANTPASFEPALDYVVTKVARFPFDKFSDASNKLGTQMKATGEVMSVGRTMEESLLKAVRSLETGVCHIYHKKFDTMSDDEMLTYIKEGTDDRLYAIAQLIRNGVDLALIYNNTKIDMFFLEKFKNIVEMERTPSTRRRCARPSAWASATSTSGCCGALPSTRCTPCARSWGFSPSTR